MSHHLADLGDGDKRDVIMSLGISFWASTSRYPPPVCLSRNCIAAYLIFLALGLLLQGPFGHTNEANSTNDDELSNARRDVSNSSRTDERVSSKALCLQIGLKR